MPVHLRLIFFVIVCSICWLFAWRLQALSELHFSIDQLQPLANDAVVFRDIELSLRFDGLQQVTLAAKSNNVKLPYFKTIQSLSIDCQLTQSVRLYTCKDGSVTIDHPLFTKPARLNFSYDDEHGLQSLTISQLNFLGGLHTIQADKRQADWTVLYHVAKLDLASLSRLLAREQTPADELSISSGLLDLTANIQARVERLKSVDLQADISNLSIDAEQVLEGVDLSTELLVKQLDERWHVYNQTRFNAGAMYLVPGFSVFDEQPGFYLDLNQQGIEYSIDGQADYDFKTLAIDSFNYLHGDTLAAKATGNLQIDPGIAVEYLDVDVQVNDLAAMYPVYFQPILLATNYADLKTSGSMQLGIRHQDGQLSHLKLDLDDLYIDDQQNRFSIANLNSRINMITSGPVQTSSITWDSIAIYKILFGAADMQLQSLANDYTVSKWQSVDVFDGSLKIDKLSLENIGEKDFKLTLDGRMQPVSLPLFTQAMQWPTMSGTLAGAISGFEYENNKLAINGDINFDVFDGNIIVSDLTIENLFSSYSRAKTDIRVSNLDLQQLTDTFTFGKVQGTLNGKLDDFTLENWQPVYFDAEFATPKDDHRPHRISQRALENLSEIGGGLSSALSGSLLKFIPEYSYGQLGLSCRLEKGVCHLGGVKETEQGFYILTSGGLLPPWVDVMGTGRSIRWDNLIEGLQQIAKGDVEIQ